MDEVSQTFDVGKTRRAPNQGHQSRCVVDKPNTSTAPECSGSSGQCKEHHRQLESGNLGVSWHESFVCILGDFRPPPPPQQTSRVGAANLAKPEGSLPCLVSVCLRLRHSQPQTEGMMTASPQLLGEASSRVQLELFQSQPELPGSTPGLSHAVSPSIRNEGRRFRYDHRRPARGSRAYHRAWTPHRKGGSLQLRFGTTLSWSRARIGNAS